MVTVRSDTSLVRSLRRGLQIMNVVATRGPVHAKLVARSVGVALPTTYHLLRTLVHDGYLARLDDGTYVLGDRVCVDHMFGGPPVRGSSDARRTGVQAVR